MNTASASIVNETSPKLEQFVTELNTLLDKYQYDMVLALDYTDSAVKPVVRIVDVPPKETAPDPTATPVDAAPVNPEPTIETPMETPVFPSQEGGTPDGQ